MEAIALTALREQWAQAAQGAGGNDLDRLAARVAAGEIDPYAAADQLRRSV